MKVKFVFIMSLRLRVCVQINFLNISVCNRPKKKSKEILLSHFKV